VKKRIASAILSLPLAAQTQRLISPEVHADRSVTFRFRAPNAKEVYLELSRGGATRTAMSRNEDGSWTVTTEPLEPDLYSYRFNADGAALLDPVNPEIQANLLNPHSLVHVHGDGLPWEIAPTPRGAVHRHFYRSAIAGDDRDYFVYTPPGYDPAGKRLYPVLYLLHGHSDDASSWTAVGRAHVILDNLIAQRRARPMIVVMPLGYGAREVVRRDGRPAAPGLRQKNLARFRAALLEEVMPAIERDYRASKDRALRAIAGLSMGGAESLDTGLNALDRFAWIGAFSAGGLDDDLLSRFSKLNATANSQLRLLWISCGSEDRLIASNRKLVEFLKSKQVHAMLRETPGGHNWRVWRRNLAEFAPALFDQ
jgi:enterochelin esterase family protein